MIQPAYNFAQALQLLAGQKNQQAQQQALGGFGSSLAGRKMVTDQFRAEGEQARYEAARARNQDPFEILFPSGGYSGESPIPLKKKTFREELRAETDEWLKDAI